MRPFGLEDFIDQIQSLSRIGAWAMDLESREVWWSPEMYRIAELPLDTPIDMERVFSLYPTEAATNIERDIASGLIEHGRFRLETPIVTAKGNGTIVRAEGAVVHKDGRKVAYGTWQDVSDEFALKRQLEEKTNFLTSVIDNFPQMIFVKEPTELRFVVFNRAGEELLGLKAKDMLGKNDYDFFSKEQADSFIEKDRQVLEERQLVDIPEETIDAPSGRRFLHTMKMPVCDAQGEPLYMLGISEDITESKRQRELIVRQQQALFHSAKMSALGEMASGIAHEVNNPLTVIQGYVYKLRSQLNEVDSSIRFKEQLDGIEQTVQRIATVIRGLRSFARDTTSDPVQPVRFAVLIDDAMNLCRERCRSKGIKLVVKKLPELSVPCRPTEISQVLLNLVSNSIDAVERTLEKWIEVSARVLEVDGMIEIAVTDSGSGVASRLRSKLFQPFFTTKDVGRGTGLGLSIARGLVENHGGKLVLDESSERTRFVLTLPLTE